MSLAVLADHMASRGRGPDSMLIHMSPREVQGLQALAENHGGSLTINPETGLPEAGFLDKLLPTIIGAGISFFSNGAIDPMTAAAMVGGAQTVRTGDIGKGISAGLGAYGGATLGAGMTTAGSTAMAGEAATLAGTEAAAYGAAQGFSPEAIDVLRRQAIDEGAMQQGMSELTGKTTTGELFSKGFEVAKNDPMAYLKANAKPLMYAAGPAILAGMSAKENMPKTTTGMIRPHSFDPYSGTYTAGTPYPAMPNRAAQGGLMGLAAGGMAGYEDDEEGMATGGMGGMFNFAQQSEPVVRMASGGVPGYAGNEGSVVGGATVSPDEAYKQYIQARNAAALQPGGALTFGGSGVASQSSVDASNAFQTQAGNQALAKLGYSMDQYGNIVSASVPPAQNLNFSSDVELANNAPSAGATYAATHKVDVAGNINKFIQDNPSATADQINTAIKNAGMTQADINPYLTANTNISDAARYALSHANEMPGAGGLAGMQANIMKGFATPNLTQGQIDTQQGLYKLSDADIQSPLSHGSQVAAADMGKAANYLATNPDVMAWLNSAEGKDYIKKHPEFDANDIAFTHYQRYGKGEGRKWEEAATKIGDVVCGPGYKKSIDGKTCVPDTTVITQETQCPTGFHYDPVLKQCVKNVDATQTTTTNVTTPTGIDVANKTALPVGVSGAGVTTINPNGTISTSPDLTLGMKDVRDAYTAGGGSLGYTSPTFASLKAVEDKYPLRGGSKQSYDFLTGKTDYDPVPYTKTGEIMKPYASSVLGIPTASSKQMYIFKNGKYEVNPDYAIPTYDKDGKKSYNLTNADVTAFMDKKPSTDAFYTWATTNNLSPEQIAQASGRSINEISKLFTGAKDLVSEDGTIDQTKVDEKAAKDIEANWDEAAYLAANPSVADELRTGKSVSGQPVQYTSGYGHWLRYGKDQGWKPTVKKSASGGLMNMAMARGGMAQQFNLGDYSDGGRLLRGPGDGVSDSIPASIGGKRPARLADGEFVVPARIVSELGNGSTEAGARKLYAMMDRIQKARRGTVGKGRVAKNSRAEKYLPA